MNSNVVERLAEKRLDEHLVCFPFWKSFISLLYQENIFIFVVFALEFSHFDLLLNLL